MISWDQILLASSQNSSILDFGLMIYSGLSQLSSHVKRRWLKLTTADWLHSFVSSKGILEEPDIRLQIEEHFHIPRLLLDRICLDSNGFAGCEPTLGDGDTLESYSMVQILR